MIAAVPFAGAASHALKERREDVRERLGEVENLAHDAGHEEEQVKRGIREVQAALRQRDERTHALSDELAELESELIRARTVLRDARAELSVRERRLADAREQSGLTESRLEARVVALYKSDRPAQTEVLVGASSVRDVLDQVELGERLVQEDSRLVRQVISARTRLSEQVRDGRELEVRRESQAQLVGEQRAERRAAQAELEHEREHLVALRDQRGESLTAITVSREEWEAEADALRADELRIQELLREASRASAEQAGAIATDQDEPATVGEPGHEHASTSGGPPPGSTGLAWPLRGALTSPFGLRWGRLHTGIDIAAPAGTVVTASAAGTVVYAGWLGAYGLIVVVDHGSGLSTAYAHNSAVSVSTGATVAQGQQVAAVGCTGSCTGDHVHFEVRVNGSPVNPLGYL